mmetsp:Transcript_57704/g.158546  ORF Transcript_57704/g.158546 Transcript_57704/m.158546 type:complete len:86 (+) Transcript_57704:984-1241(+)|eukprot:3034906-Prymnesium_polylepis.1
MSVAEENLIAVVERRCFKGCWIIWALPHSSTLAAKTEEEHRKPRRALSGICVEPDFLSIATFLSGTGGCLRTAASKLENLVMQNT